MTLNNIWKTRRPLIGDPNATRGSYFLDSFHTYVTAYEVWRNVLGSSSSYEHQVVYGELRLCESVGIRRAPIPNHHVRQVKYRMPYARCDKCVEQVEWAIHMKFNWDIVVMR